MILNLEIKNYLFLKRTRHEWWKRYSLWCSVCKNRKKKFFENYEIPLKRSLKNKSRNTIKPEPQNDGYIYRAVRIAPAVNLLTIFNLYFLLFLILLSHFMHLRIFFIFLKNNFFCTISTTFHNYPKTKRKKKLQREK